MLINASLDLALSKYPSRANPIQACNPVYRDLLL